MTTPWENYNTQEIFNAAMNYDTDNLSNATWTLLSMDKWAALESCSTKIFNENLFIKSGDMVSFDL